MPSVRCYEAYGVTIASEISLPGLRTAGRAAGGLRTRIRGISSADLARRWAQTSETVAWRADVSPGSVLDVRREPAGAHRFRWDGRAVYEVSADGTNVRFAADQQSPAVTREFCDSALAWVGLVQGLEGLHAAAVAVDGAAVALMASAGQGKTTLAASLLDLGGNLVADDLLMLQARSAGVEALPGPCSMNLPRSLLASRPAWVGQVHAIFKDEEWVDCTRTVEGPVQLGALVLIERTRGRDLGMEPATLTVVDLLPHALGVRGLPDRELRRFDIFSTIASSVPGWRLRVPLGCDARAVARLIGARVSSECNREPTR